MVVPTPLVDVALIAVAVVGLWFGADQFVDGAARLARRLGVPGLIVGLTVIAFGTSAPEFAVSLDAAFSGSADISVANVVGSNVVNLGFVLGGAALVRALPISPALVRRDSLALIGAATLVLVFLRDLRISRGEGAVFVVLLVGYLAVLARSASGRDTGEQPMNFRPRELLRLVGGLAVVVASAHLLVLAATALARDAGVSEWTIGVTIVAGGTSLPEFVTAVVAARRGRAGLSAGNLVGSCLFNCLGVLGVTALVRPLPVVPAAVESTGWLVGLAVLVTALFWSGRVLSRSEGALLVAVNVLDWAAELLR